MAERYERNANGASFGGVSGREEPFRTPLPAVRSCGYSHSDLPMTRLLRSVWRALPIGALILASCASARSLFQGGGWIPLFDGTSTAAWHGYHQPDMPKGWEIVDGVLTKKGTANDIMTRQTFGDFELELEWKLAKGGNSGI